jgi:hypothetical protein
MTGTFLFVCFFAFAHMKTDKNITTKSSKIEELKSLPYLSFVLGDNKIEKNGTTIYKHNLSDEGINIYNSLGRPGAFLVDMAGNILRTILPKKSHWNWQYVKINNEGDLLVIIKDNLLMKLDWNSNIKSSVNMRFHQPEKMRWSFILDSQYLCL